MGKFVFLSSKGSNLAALLVVSMIVSRLTHAHRPTSNVRMSEIIVQDLKYFLQQISMA